MKLAEALMARADLQRRIESLKSRTVLNARFQEGEEPSENAQALIDEAQQLISELEQLMIAINLTNASSSVPDGSTLTAALARREALRLQHSLLTTAADAAQDSHGAYRQMRSELRRFAAIPVDATRKRADEVARTLRDLDVTIQKANWEVDLLN